MKKSKSKKPSVAVDPYLEGLMAKLLERLTNLDRKMDAVLSRSGARPSGGGEQPKPFENPRANEQPRRDRIMYEAICADCQKVCEVPFKPSEGRAIYCKPCFAKRKSGGSGAVNMPRPVSVYQKQPQPTIPQAAAVPASAKTPAKAKKKAPAKKSKKK